MSRWHKPARAYLMKIALLAVFATSASAQSEFRTYVFICDNQQRYVVRADATGAWVFHPTGSLRLSAVPAASGYHYSGEQLQIRIAGEQAYVIGPAGKQSACRNNRREAVWEQAKLDGADFRATGNEPGWNLVILSASRIVLVSDYGESRIEVPLPEPEINSEARTALWDAGELVLKVSGRRCRDSMSGEEFESTVVVTTKTQTLYGCGRALH